MIINIQMRNQIEIFTIFCVLIGIFVALISAMFIPIFREFIGFSFMVTLVFGFFVLGIALIFLTLKRNVKGVLKRFLILTGASAAGILVSILLHNFFYGLFIILFGTDFWDRIGLGDEILFFFMGILICPITFLIGVVGSIIMYFKERKNK